jgi:hypothetical protein
MPLEAVAISAYAQSRRVTRAGKCPLIGAKQTWRRHRGMSVVDPNAKWGM